MTPGAKDKERNIDHQEIGDLADAIAKNRFVKMGLPDVPCRGGSQEWQDAEFILENYVRRDAILGGMTIERLRELVRASAPGGSWDHGDDDPNLSLVYRMSLHLLTLLAGRGTEK